MKYSLLAGMIVAAFSSAAHSQANIIFHWIDSQGNLHATDRLQDVPEPYYGLYAAKLRALVERNAQNSQGPSPAAAPSPAPSVRPSNPGSGGISIVDAEIARRKHWKDTMAEWRRELETATEKFTAIDGQIQSLEMNPILRLTPQVEAQVTALQTSRSQALARVERARVMLTETLPKQARVESVPPAWLQ